MRQTIAAFVKGGASRFGDDREGSVIVEFALISTVLMALFAAAVDFSYMAGANRDAERSSTLLVRAMSSCPFQTTLALPTWQGTDCVTKTLQMVSDRKANVLVSIPTAVLQSAAIQRTNGAILMCPGVSNYMPSSVSSNVMSVLGQDNDSGMFAVIEVNYIPFLPNVLKDYGVTTNPKYSKPSIDLWGNGSKFACAVKS